MRVPGFTPRFRCQLSSTLKSNATATSLKLAAPSRRGSWSSRTVSRSNVCMQKPMRLPGAASAAGPPASPASDTVGSGRVRNMWRR